MSRDKNSKSKPQRISKISNSGSSAKPRSQKSARPRTEKSEESKEPVSYTHLDVYKRQASGNQFYIAAAVAVILGIYSFTLPKCPPQNLIPANATLSEKLGLNAFSLFKDYKMALFFFFSMFLGAALQLTNMYGDTFLSDFGKIPEYA